MTSLMKLTIKQEAFCKAYIELGSATAAYKQAYDCKNMAESSVNVNASKMLKDTKIALRINALQAEHATNHCITVNSLIDELEVARYIAMAESQIPAMINAIMCKAKLLGFIKN